MHIASILLQNFRNYESTELDFKSSGALIIGKNGSGKTNLLEAIHLLCTGRSHRGASRRTMIRKGNQIAFVKAHFIDDSHLATSVQLGFGGDNKLQIKVNDVKAKSISEWFSRGKVVPFGPPDLMLIQGSPAERRKFMDIVLSQADNAYLENLLLYKKSLLQRNALLSRFSNYNEISLYEHQMAVFGMYVMQKRNEFFNTIAEEFSNLYAHINSDVSQAGISYKPSFSSLLKNESIDIEDFKEQLSNRRKKDRELAYTFIGPHRDDFTCRINQGRASLYASQGQCRALSIALRLCSISYLQHSGAHDNLVLLVDDAFGELDMQRVSRVYPLIKDKGQLFITSTSPEAPYADDLECITVNAGMVSVAA